MSEQNTEPKPPVYELTEEDLDIVSGGYQGGWNVAKNAEAA